MIFPWSLLLLFDSRGSRGDKEKEGESSQETNSDDDDDDVNKMIVMMFSKIIMRDECFEEEEDLNLVSKQVLESDSGDMF